jgi:hypothetical protein
MATQRDFPLLFFIESASNPLKSKVQRCSLLLFCCIISKAVGRGLRPRRAAVGRPARIAAG